MSRFDRNKRKRDVWEKTHGRCAHCGKYASGYDRTIDHVIPKSQGGTYDLRNLMPLCRECNWKRGSRIINPETFYRYAPYYAIRQCITYQKIYNRRVLTMADVEEGRHL